MLKVIFLGGNGEGSDAGDLSRADKDDKSVMEGIIREVLEKSGFSTGLTGFSYLMEAVLLCYENPDLIICKTKVLYPYLAEINNVRAQNIERNMRTAIKSAWTKCGGNNFYLRIGCKYVSDNKQPTCSEIINLLTRYLQDLMK